MRFHRYFRSAVPILCASLLAIPGIPAAAEEQTAPAADRVIIIELPRVEEAADSASVIEADEPLIAALLASDPDFTQCASLTLTEITSSSVGADGMTLFQIPVEDSAETVLWQSTGSDIQETSLTGVDAGGAGKDGAAAVSYFSGTNHWLAVRFTAKDAETAEVPAETAIVEETAEETAAESLEGKTDPETDASEARAETAKAETAKAQSTTKAAETTKAATRAAETKASTAPTKATTAPTKATSAPTTAAPTKGTTKAAETTAPTTTAHVHSWVPVTKTVHHDATTRQVWVVDQAAYDETVVVTPAYDEQVLAQAAYDETVVVTPAYDEPVYDWQQVCNVCGYVFPIGTSGDDIVYHETVDPGCGGGYHAIQVQVGTNHHDAVTQVVHHDAVYTTVHHDAVTKNVHHDEVGHYETVTDKAAYDETVTTGYKCSVCGATK
jgi:hypothetical protein